MDKMFAGANAAAQKSGEIARLQQELNELKAAKGDASDFQKIRVDRIVPLRLPEGMGQPRKYFDPVKLEQLRDSIKRHGILEPILVRPADDELYETVSGERRWKCCLDLGYDAILARIKPLADKDALEVALIATIHAEGVSLIEETDSVLALIKLYLEVKDDWKNQQIKSLLERAKNYRQTGYGDITEQEVELIEATLISFGFNLGSFVSNRLPLLNIAPSILEAVRMGELNPTNALLINRASSVHHGALIEFGKSATKAELMQEIRLKRDSGNGCADIPRTLNLRDKVHVHYGKVRKKSIWKKIEANPKLKKKMERVESILAELLKAAEMTDSKD